MKGNDDTSRIGPARRSRRRLWIAATTVVVTVSFFTGYATASWRNRQTVFEEGCRQFREFLRIGSELGFIEIDHQRLTEAIIATAESEWEDRDAAERETSVKKENRQEEP